jgi:hypothetical protein
MRTDRSALSWLCALLAFAPAVLAGCPGKLDDKDAFVNYTAGSSAGGGAGFANGAAGESADAGAAGTSNINLGPCGDVVARIFVPSCGGTGCHGATAPQEGLDLVSSGVAARVVGVAGKGCSGTLADPSNPANSLLYTKLSTQPPCGAQMPLAQPPLSDDDATCVLDWIASQ